MATKSILPILRHRFDENVFPSVNLEIATDCNYRCTFCPQSSHRRRSQYITGDGFRFVLDELKRIHFSGLFVLSVNNEPFMHPLLLSFCEQISVDLPAATCQIISNGSLIKKDDLVFLARLSRPPVLDINDYTENHTIAPRIREWVASLGTGRSLAVNISLRLRSEKLSNRAGNQAVSGSRPADYRDIVCTWLFMGLFLTPDLRAFLCCSDYRYEVILGDLKRQPLMDIWKGAGYREIRRKMMNSLRRDIALCSRCDAEWFVLPQHCCRKD